jgi:predicted site-specific integrase-resolvase
VLATADSEAHSAAPEFLRASAMPIDEALEHLQIDRSTAYRYIELGRLAKIKHGGRTWITRKSIREYEEALIEEATKQQIRAARAHKRTQ